MVEGKPIIVVTASPRARGTADSTLLKLARDYEPVLKRYRICATEHTGDALLSTGLYREDVDVFKARSGDLGGTVELAALVARNLCKAVFLLLDPGDPSADTAENWALRRVSIRRGVYLITNYSGAVHWAIYTGARPLNDLGAPRNDPLIAIDKGVPNITPRGNFRNLPVHERTVALISHDKKKAEMLLFANENMTLLKEHHRILTTGTTGWALKLLYATSTNEEQYLEQAGAGRHPAYDRKHRLASVFADILEQLRVPLDKMADFGEMLSELRRHLRIDEQDGQIRDAFTQKLMPLSSGPEGGDVLIAREVLNNLCHSVIFFHDPMTAQPHNDDIRLLEHTCELPRVYADCVSNKESADQWVLGLKTEIEQSSRRMTNPLNLSQELELRFDLSEVIIVHTDDNKDSERLASALARATAPYFHQRIIDCLRVKDQPRFAIGHGTTVNQVCEALRLSIGTIPLAQLPMPQPEVDLNKRITWTSLSGTIQNPSGYLNASTIALKFQELYQGSSAETPGFSRVPGLTERFDSPAFTRDFHRFADIDQRLKEILPSSDLILTAAAPGKPNSPLNQGAKSRKPFPRDITPTAIISGVLLDDQGNNIPPTNGFTHAGLDFEGLKSAADNGSVIVICGGNLRNAALLAILKAKVVSVLVTTSKSAEWILQNS
jgi:methylglyoxal synthase